MEFGTKQSKATYRLGKEVSWDFPKQVEVSANNQQKKMIRILLSKICNAMHTLANMGGFSGDNIHKFTTMQKI